MIEQRTCSDCGKSPVSPRLTTLCCACAHRGARLNARGGDGPIDDDDRHGSEPALSRFAASEGLSWR